MLNENEVEFIRLITLFTVFISGLGIFAYLLHLLLHRKPKYPIRGKR